MSKFVKIGNTSFNKGAIKKMGKKRFLATYKNLLKGVDLEEAYHLITGRAKPNK
jgi:hypothetical protein